jgi:hypothetical protein
MALVEKQDYVYYPSGLMMSSRQPLKTVDVCTVSTKNKIFFVPKKSVGEFIILSTITTHQYFNGVSIEEGVKEIISKSGSTAELETAMTALLDNDVKYIHNVADQKSFRFRGFLGKHTLRMSTGGANWTSIMAKGKGMSKEFRGFHGQ